MSLQGIEGKETLEIEREDRRKPKSEQQEGDPLAPSSVAARRRALMTNHREPPPGQTGSALSTRGIRRSELRPDL